MAQKFLTNLDLNKNELQNAKIQNLGTAPSSPATGQIYFNTSDNELYIYDGSGWVSLQEQGDITGVTAGTGLSGGGTSGAVTVNFDPSGLSAVTVASDDKVIIADTNDSDNPKTVTAQAIANLAPQGDVTGVTAGTNLNGGGASGDVTLNLDSDISIATATFSSASPLVFEGATADDFETTFAITDPTADRTITFQDATGTVAHLDSDITGNAATATALETARTIGGVSFDGTANINLPGVNTAGNQNTSGNAATATALETARTIAGTSFDGTANISIDANNLSGTTLNSGVTGSSLTSVGTLASLTVSGLITANGGLTIQATDTFTFDSVALTTVQTSGESFADNDTSLMTSAAINDLVGSSGVTSLTGTANEVEVDTTTGDITVGLPNNVTISGNLTVNGDTTTVNTATLSVEDPLIILANGNNAADSVDIGFYGLYDTSGSQDLYAGLFRDANDSGKFKLFKDLQVEPTTTVNTGGAGYTAATLVVGTLEGAVTGNVTGDVTGNADTATALETARTIGGVSFDGTANINLPGVNTSGTQDTSGNAATATALETARTINGTSFDGTANITVTAAAGTLTGTELNSSVVTSSLTALGTIATGVWAATDVAVAHGGTGASDAAGAKTNLGFVTRHAETIGDNSATAIAVTHNLGTDDVVVEVYDASTKETVICDVDRTSTNAVTLTFSTAPGTNAIRVVVIG
jgi:hypothetical protein